MRVKCPLWRRTAPTILKGIPATKFLLFKRPLKSDGGLTESGPRCWSNRERRFEQHGQLHQIVWRDQQVRNWAMMLALSSGVNLSWRISSKGPERHFGLELSNDVGPFLWVSSKRTWILEVEVPFNSSSPFSSSNLEIKSWRSLADLKVPLASLLPE